MMTILCELNRKILRIIICTFLLLVITIPNYALALSNTTLDRIVTQIESLYPPLEGYVIEVEGNGLTLDLKQGMQVKKGDRLKLIRYGRELFHPVTKKKVGRKETDLGEVEILEVRKDFSRARSLNPTALRRKGDGVRSPFQKLTFLVAPPNIKARKKIDAEQLHFNLEKKLNEHPRFEVPAFDFGLWIADEKLSETSALTIKNLRRLKRKVNVDLILIPQVRTVRGKIVLSYKLMSAADGTLQKQAKVLSDDDLPTAEARRKRGAQTPFDTKENKFQFIDKEQFPYEIVDFDVGDLDGDGKNEYVLIDHYRIMVYKLKKGKLRKIQQMRTQKGINRLLGVDVGDINGNGRDEIFVTSWKGDKLESFALERQVRKKRLKYVWKDVNLYFRIIRPFGQKPTLLSQSPGFEIPFIGPIKKVVFKNRRYIQGSKLNTPDIYGTHFILYGLTQANLGRNKVKETVVLDNKYHLRVYSPSGKVVIKSDVYYGHDPRLIEVGVVDEELGNLTTGGGASVGREDPVRYKGRLQFVKNGGRRFLVLPKNYVTGNGLLSEQVIVNNSGLVILGVNREGFEKVFESNKQKGFLAAFRVVPRKGNAGADVHILRTERNFISNAVSGGMSSFSTYFWKAD